MGPTFVLFFFAQNCEADRSTKESRKWDLGNLCPEKGLELPLAVILAIALGKHGFELEKLAERSGCNAEWPLGLLLSLRSIELLPEGWD